MNINYIKTAFNNHVEQFDTSDTNITRKIIHSNNVAKNACNIAKSLNLDKDNVELATAIGYFHDIARFKQWQRFKTYSDKLSFDHGDEALNILFKQKLIEKFKVDKKYYNIIAFCVKNHNKFNISINELETEFKDEFFNSEQMILHAKIVRDADKLDLYRIMKEGKMPAFNSEYKSGGITKEVLDNFRAKKLIEPKFINTVLDRVVAQAALVYDFNFEYTKQAFIKNNYYEVVVNNYKSQLNEEQNQIIKNIMKNFKETFKKKTF